MKYKYNTRRRAIEYEKDIAKRWKNDKTFEKSVEQRDPANAYVFYDGPPFANGTPHHGHLLGSTVKDLIGRYWTMKGKRVERVWGWDCHGLPVEKYTENQMGILDRRDIGTKISIEDYVKQCRKNVSDISDEWEHTIDRVGRWVDFRGAYRTMDKDFMESVWWAFKKLYDAGKIYEGKKVLMYDTKFATPVSKAEVTMDNDAYQTVTDPSVFVKFKLAPESIGSSTRKLGLPVYLLAWTTTPWTLPANMALAVNPNLTYSEIKVGEEIFILAKDLIEKVLVDEKKQPIKYDVLHEFSGEKLAGKQYTPLFPDSNVAVVAENKEQK